MNKVEQINPYEDERSKKAQVEDMFDGIAPAYDLMNRAMTFGLDRLWLHALVNAVAGAAPADIVDRYGGCCAGPGTRHTVGTYHRPRHQRGYAR